MAATTRATSPCGDLFAQPAGVPAVSAPEAMLRSQPRTLTSMAMSPKSTKAGASPRLTSSPLTGAAAVASLKRRREDSQNQQDDSARSTSPNPAVTAVRALMDNSTSNASGRNKLSEPLRKAAQRIHIPEPGMSLGDTLQGESLQASPTSLASFGTPESVSHNPRMTATAGPTATSVGPLPSLSFVAEPADLAGPGRSGAQHEKSGDQAAEAAKAQTYPGPVSPQPAPATAPSLAGSSRGMSFPGIATNSRAPAPPKKHKCPSCNTEFTRQHNLKSHLLTHSEEKPFDCDQCTARFRRLHDLKRHSKLHTGERPHQCDKCCRTFARGDALARHNKGAGGCAGRRSGVGGIDEDDEDKYVNGGQGPSMPVTDQRRGSEPSRKRIHLDPSQSTARQMNYRQASGTYPPIGPLMERAQAAGTMGPPQAPAGPSTSPRGPPNHSSPLNPPSYAPYTSYAPAPALSGHPAGSMITDSPKTLSPGPPEHRMIADCGVSRRFRNQSPSISSQLSNPVFNRPVEGPPASHLRPHAHMHQHVPTLPPIGSTQSRAPRTALQPSVGPNSIGPVASIPPQPSIQLHPAGPAPQMGSISTHGRPSGSSLRELVPTDAAELWRQMESRMERIREECDQKIDKIAAELTALKQQLAQPSYSGEMNRY
ncbi:hypothetical protein K470DRAFT_104871 [Piedraia hortae CBS 480.64]|uniref:C2H2-type domain-containing protein n=1 Tax=Piedraia hortae CBS 480.64 TaxID=1314780 RepID=A0A6A7C841_9PEZI|nr:hypothetical protein K470DRAFT_104871 [Piedraia hortae CBS 480.64]